MQLDKDLEAEIEDVLRRQLEKDTRYPVVANWIAQEVMQLHDLPESPEANWYLRHTRLSVRRLVGIVVRKFQLPSRDSELVAILPGFERVQEIYAIEKTDASGEKHSEIVRTRDMTWEELEMKILEYRKMGKGCFAHADELARLQAELWPHREATA